MMPNERRLAMRQPVTSIGPSLAFFKRLVWCRMVAYSDAASVPLRWTRLMMILPSYGEAVGGMTGGTGVGVFVLLADGGVLRRNRRPSALRATGWGFCISELPGPVGLGPEPERSRESVPLWLNAMTPAMRTTTTAMMPSAFMEYQSKCAPSISGCP